MGLSFFGRSGRTQKEIEDDNARILAGYQKALKCFDEYIASQLLLQAPSKAADGRGELAQDLIKDTTGSIETSASSPLLVEDDSAQPFTVSVNRSDKTVQELKNMRNTVVRCVNDHKNPRVMEVMTRALKATQAYADPVLRKSDPNVAKEYARSHWAVTRLGDAAKGVSVSMFILGCAGYLLGGALIGTGFGALFGLAIMLGSTAVFLAPALSVAVFTRGKGTESLDREIVGQEMSVVKCSGVR